MMSTFGSFCYLVISIELLRHHRYIPPAHECQLPNSVVNVSHQHHHEFYYPYDKTYKYIYLERFFDRQYTYNVDTLFALYRAFLRCLIVHSIDILPWVETTLSMTLSIYIGTSVNYALLISIHVA